MIRATRELLAALAAMNRKIPEMCLALMDDTLSPQRQAEFGELLIQLGEALREHARTERAEVVEGMTTDIGHDLAQRD
ncbi:MAG: hypothetical protein ACRDQ5_17820 [Sciscionella sp.]